jgi:hypothetical protein
MTIIHSTIPESQLQETVELVEFHIPEEFKREESDRLLDLFRPRNHYLPPDWFLRKNNVGQNILYWSIQFNQTQLTAAVLWHFSYLKRYEEKGFLSFLKDHENGDKNILALAFDTSGSNPNTARLTIISELLSYKDIVEQLLDHENRLEDERHQGSLHIAAVHGVLSVFQKLQEWYGEKLDEWLQNYQREEKDSLTPLDIAIEKGNVEIVKILITSYQRPEPTLDERTNLELLPGTSILHKALNVLTPNQDIVNLIMQYYPELLWQYNKESKTPLMELRHMINTRRQSRKFRADQVPTGEAEEMLTYLETKLFRSDWPISKINRSLGLELEGCKYFS